MTLSAYESPLLGLNQFISISALTLGAVQIIFLLNFLGSLFFGRQTTDRNPWKSNTLEWTTPTPPGHGNFETVPVVYHGPYEYGEFPGLEGDHLMQTQKYAGPTPSDVH
jgi:cytochrome c oxidase subunit 1